MLPGQDLDFGGQVTVATAPDENRRSQRVLVPTMVLVGGPSGLPYLLTPNFDANATMAKGGDRAMTVMSVGHAMMPFGNCDTH